MLAILPYTDPVSSRHIGIASSYKNLTKGSCLLPSQHPQVIRVRTKEEGDELVVIGVGRSRRDK